MDAPLFVYFIKVNVAFVAIYLFYRLLLHKDTFFHEKRMAFLLTYAFALLHPLIDPSLWLSENKPVVSLLHQFSTNLPDIVITANQATSNVMDWVYLGYGMVAAALLLRMMIQLLILYRMIRKQPRISINGQPVVVLSKNSTPFSFFRWLFIHPESYNAHDLDEIIFHEHVHIRQHHSIDVLLAECICACCWINPFVWLLKRHQRENLEFLADKNVLHAGFDSKTYQYHLLRLSYQDTSVQLANHFNVNQLKNRIIMMNKKRTSWAGLTKYALCLPLFAFLVLGTYAWSAKNNLTTLAVLETPPSSQAGEKNTISETVTVNPPKEVALMSAEVMPVFPGGETALSEYIKKNLNYPASAIERGIHGNVVVRFVIASNGDVSNVEVARSLDSICDNEAIRVIKAMPKWTPGKQDGKNVPVLFNLPITFKLDVPPATKVTISITDVPSITKVSVLDNKPNTTAVQGFDEKEPLFVVNGKYYQIQGLKITTEKNLIFSALNINPTNVKEIAVLKDEAAKNVYGKMGANGVVVITLK